MLWLEVGTKCIESQEEGVTPDLLEQLYYESYPLRNTVSGCLSQKIVTIVFLRQPLSNVQLVE